MSLRASTDADPMISERWEGRVRGLRRASFAAFVILLVQYGFGMYTNLYVTIPGSDHGQGIGQAISNGPAALSLHVVLGLLLILAAIGVFVQAIIARHWAVLAAGFIALVAIIGAAFAGSGFAGGTQAASASMSMAVLTGVAMLCYGIAVYLLPSPPRR
ncbi:MAG TPA: hypothetical protein VK817_03450 [Trebonia sp.]|jgi:hypothetical protein|nr:hypothetical protein [Trebonia sp.]